MQPMETSPKKPSQKSPYEPKVFYSDSVGFSNLRLILIHKKAPLYLAGAFQFQCLAGQVSAKSFIFNADDYEENSLTPVCAPSTTHDPICFQVPKTAPSLLSSTDEDVIYKRLSTIDFKFDPIKKIIQQHGYDAIILVTDPPARIKPIENISGLPMFKPLPDFEPEELSPYCYKTNAVNDLPKVSLKSFCEDLRRNWQKHKITVGMITGAKNSGKSTVSKQVCNCLLTLKPDSSSNIYYLDCDIGQSEFTPPGLLSIFKIEKPIMSAPFASQTRTFCHSFYFGDVNPQSNLDLYLVILQQFQLEFHEMNQNDTHSLLLINTLGWVENFGRIILDRLADLFRPQCTFAFAKNTFYYLPEYCKSQNYYIEEAHTVENHRNISASKLRELAITGYFTQCFMKSMNLEVASFSDVSVRMISFDSIGIFIHPSHFVSERTYLAALNMSTVALCMIPKEFGNSFIRKRLCDKENLPFKIEYSDTEQSKKAFFKCVGYGLIRAISIENRKIYIITPAIPEALVDVDVLAMGNDIYTPQCIFQTQNASDAPYLMHTKRQEDDFDRLSMPLKIIGSHKRNTLLRGR